MQKAIGCLRSAVGYCRVSTDKQGDHGISLSAQVEKVRQYATLYDINLVDVVSEVASAKTLARPGLARALAMLDSGAATALIVPKLDRLTRSVRDLGELISGPFSRHDLLSVGDHIDTRTAAGRLCLNMLASVSQWEREAIGERTRAALAFKRSQGVRLGPPIRREPELEKAASALRASGATHARIAAALGVTPSKVARLLSRI